MGDLRAPQSEKGVSRTANAVTASLPIDRRTRSKYTQNSAGRFWRFQLLEMQRVSVAAGAALLAELVPERRHELREVEAETGPEQPPWQHALAREQCLFAHFAEHELHRKLRDRRQCGPVEHLA